MSPLLIVAVVCLVVALLVGGLGQVRFGRGPGSRKRALTLLIPAVVLAAIGLACLLALRAQSGK